MIRIAIETDGKVINERFTRQAPTVSEVAIVLMRLEQIKNSLLGEPIVDDVFNFKSTEVKE